MERQEEKGQSQHVFFVSVQETEDRMPNAQHELSLYDKIFCPGFADRILFEADDEAMQWLSADKRVNFMYVFAIESLWNVSIKEMTKHVDMDVDCSR